MASEITQRFIDALHQLEQTGEADAIANLFADDAELINHARSSAPRGRQGAQDFWRRYRGAFDHIHSEFASVHEAEGFAVLEWRAQGAQRRGEPIDYDGISVIEFGDNQIHRFATYYDSRAFGNAQARKAA